MAESLDFQINDLKFRAAISDKFPYARATAPFRKEQFDSAPTVGDQSLSGWWTRGQLSFHKGAGIKYYEVLAGDEILDRYDDSLRVEVSEPGKATLARALTDKGVTATKAVPGTLSGAEGLFVLGGGSVYFFDGSTSTPTSTSDGGTPTDIASDGRYYYICNGSRIERQSSAALARTNWVTDPSIETDISAWSTYIGTAPTMTHSSVRAKYGTKSLEVAPVAGGSTGVKTTVPGLTVGQSYRASVWVYLPAGTSATGVSVLFGSGTYTAKAVSKDTWARVDHYWTATATSTDLAVIQNTTPVSGDKFFVDGVLVTEAPFDGDFFDGDNGGEWTGTANASTSTYATSAPGASNLLWEHEQTSIQWRGVWWAKGRLWAVDDAGRWYMLAPSGGTVATDDTFWSSGRLEGTWSLADGPSSVYVAIDTDIYSIGLDTEGGVPVVATPPVAASVPLNEAISHIDYYLGSLVICSNTGVRVGVSAGNGEVVYGPIVVKGNFASTNAIGKQATRVYVTGVPEGHDGATVCAVDLGSEVAEFQPAWYPYHELGTTASTVSGVTFSTGDQMYAWAAGALYGADGSLASTGYLKTGLHRFGTLEGKHFSGVKVRVGGGGGTVDVYLVERSGTETLLGTIDAAVADGADISLGMSGPAEAIGLKFVLNRAGLEGPELLGYQLKALPSPIRQRLIQWPVVASDAYRDRYGKEHGKRDGAWDAWTILEQLEENDALVTYTDHRTGETGEAFIENIELQSDTPSQGATSGFGGIGMITLRKVG